MERFIEQTIKKKVRIIDKVAKKDFGVSINDVLKVMELNEEIHFMRDEWVSDTVISTVARANTEARNKKEIEEYEYKYTCSNLSKNKYVIVSRNI